MKIQPTDIHADTVERAQEISPAVGMAAFNSLRIMQVRHEVKEELQREFTPLEYVPGGIDK